MKPAKLLNYENALMTFSVVFILITSILNFWALDKGFISADEGWFMYLTRERITDVATHGHILFSKFNCFSDIYYNRLCCLCLRTCADILFSYGFSLWIKNAFGKKVSFIAVWGLISLCFLGIYSVATMNYSQLIHIIALSTLGFLFWGLAKENNWLFLLSGLVIAQFFPVKITSFVLAPFVLATVFFCSERRINNSLWWIGGFIIGILLYCFLVESPQEIYDWIYTTGKMVAADKTSLHSPWALVLWIQHTCIYYLRWTILAFVLVHLPQEIKKFDFFKNNEKYCIVAIVLAEIVVIRFFWSFVQPIIKPHTIGYFLQSLLYVLAILTLAYLWKEVKHRKIIGVGLLLITAPCVSFGTDVDFMTSQLVKYTCAVMALIPVLDKRRSKLFEKFVIMFYIVFLCLFARSLHKGSLSNWHGDIYNMQTIPVKEKGFDQRIKLDAKYMKRLLFYKERVPKGASVLVSRDYWGDAFLLKSKPLTSTFSFLSDEQYMEIINKELAHQQDIYILYPLVDEAGNASLWKNFIHTLSSNSYHVVTDSLQGNGLTIISNK